jgi:hypothetical protein
MVYIDLQAFGRMRNRSNLTQNLSQNGSFLTVFSASENKNQRAMRSDFEALSDVPSYENAREKPPARAVNLPFSFRNSANESKARRKTTKVISLRMPKQRLTNMSKARGSSKESGTNVGAVCLGCHGSMKSRWKVTMMRRRTFLFKMHNQPIMERRICFTLKRISRRRTVLGILSRDKRPL